MANTASAKKRIRSSARKQKRNRVYRVAARTYIKKTRQLIVEGDFEAADQMAKKAVSTLDKAASRNILHRRNTSRRKSRLMKALATARKSAAD